MTKKYYVITISNGDKYGVPAEIIAKNRADYYFDGDDNEWNEHYDAMMNWFDKDDFEFADWAKNNMNWSDVKDSAVLLEHGNSDIDFEECWVNSEYDYLTVGSAGDGE